MRQLARAFSALALLGFLVMGAALTYLRPPMAPGLPPLTGQIDRIEIDKSARRMTLLRGGETLRIYQIALGFSPNGDKIRQGDGRTPEGIYRINRRNKTSAYHLSLGLDYPQPSDIAAAQAGGYDPGGDIMIHGQPNALPDAAQIAGDWTAGCIAVTNAEIRQIFAATPMGTEVEITP
jgi:murein L,D-transpeptidase YafK